MNCGRYSPMVIVSERKSFFYLIEIFNIVFRVYSDRNTQLSMKSSHVLLSSSVGVPQLKKHQGLPRPFEIVNDLEEDYKPRYKSDYFAQDGKVRPPRYVADKLGNHFVSIKVDESFIKRLYLSPSRSELVFKVTFELIG